MPRSSRACWTHSAASRAVITSSRSARAVSPEVTSRARARMAPVAREVAGVGDAVEVAGVEDDEAAGGVEDVDGADLAGLGVPDRGAEHGRDPGGVGEPEQPGGVRAAARGALGTAVEDDLDGEAVAREEGPPAGEEVAGALAVPGEDGAPDVGVRAEEDDEPGRAVVLPPRLRHLVRPRGGSGGVGARRCVRTPHEVGVAGPAGEEVGGGDRGAALAAQVGAGDEPAERRPAGAALRSPDRPRASTVTRGRRGSTIAPPRAGVRVGRGRGPGRRSVTARSTPRTGSTPAPPHACAKRIAP